ncbi:MAG: phosphatase PAP2 family protein [Sphingomicrobium sp.]
MASDENPNGNQVLSDGPRLTGSAESLTARPRIALLAAVLASIWLAMLVGGTGLLDQRVYEALYVGRDPALVSAARFVTFFGEPTVLIFAGVVFAVVMWRRGHLRTGLTLVAVTMIGRAISELQKYEVHRVRPALEPHMVLVKSQSFPSGHSASSMIFYLTLALVLTHRSRWRPLAAAAAILMSVMIGTSRVMLGVHWPSDVIGGWTFGLLWVLLTLRLAEHLFNADSRRAAHAL